MAGQASYDELAPYLLSSRVIGGLDHGEQKGAGAYGAVYQVTVNGTPCIAKRLHGILVNQQVSKVERTAIQQQFRRECVLLSKLKHPNIVHFIGVHYGTESGDISLIMEQLYTDLATFLEPLEPSNNCGIRLSVKVSVLLDVCYGLYYLHGLRPPVLHRDLSANNILLTTSLQAKIADLGVSKLFDPDVYARATAKLTKAPGSQNYMPPEALKETPKYDEKLDIFSFGHLTLYTVTEKFPQVHEVTITHEVVTQRAIQILKRRKALDFMGDAHPLYQMTIGCLRDQPGERPTIEELMKLLKDLNSQHPMTCSDVIQATGEVEPVRVENDQLKNENEELQHDLDTMRRQVRESQTQIEALERANHELQDGKRRLLAQSTHVAHLSSQLEATRQESDQLKKEKEDLQHDLNDMTHQVATMRQKNDLLKNENEKLQHDLVRHQESSVDDIQKIVSTLSEAEHSRQDLSQQLQRAQAQIEALERANRELQDGKRRLLAQSTHATHLSSQLEATKQESDQLKKEKEDLQHDLDTMRQQVEEYREGFEHERRDREDAAGHRKEHEGRINYEYHQYQQQKEAEIHQYQAQLEQERAAYGKLVDKFDELRLQFVSYKEDVEKQKKEKRVGKGSERNEVEKLVADTARLSDEVLRKTQQAKQYEKRVETYKAQRDQALQQVDSYKNQLGMIQQQGGVNVEEVDIKIATAESEKEEAKKQLQDMKKERDKLAGELEALKVKVAETASSHDGREANQHDRMRIAVLAEHTTRLTQENEMFKATILRAGIPLPSVPQKLASPDQPIPRAKFQASEPRKHALDMASQQRQHAPPKQHYPDLHSQHPGFQAGWQAHPRQNPPQQFADPVYSQAAAERRAPHQDPYYQPHGGAPLSLASTRSQIHGEYQRPPPHPHGGAYSKFAHAGPMPPQHPAMRADIMRESAGARQSRRPQSLVDNVPYTPPAHVGTPPPHYALPKHGNHAQPPTSVAENSKHYNAESEDKPRGETLVHSLSLEISETVEGYNNLSMGDGFEEVTPFDPNLVCPYCNRQFRIGQIQTFRRHVGVCNV